MSKARLVGQYLCDEMPDESRKQFLQQLHLSGELRKELEFQQLIIRELSDGDIRQFRLMVDNVIQHGQMQRRLTVGIRTVVGIAATFFCLVLMRFQEQPLCADNFSPPVITRGESANQTNVWTCIENQDYDQAIAQIEDEIRREGMNAKDGYLLSVAKLLNGEPKEALQIADNFLGGTNNLYQDELSWVVFVSAYKTNNQEKLSQMVELFRSKSSPNIKRASAFLCAEALSDICPLWAIIP
ncbi:MAG: hypothetical protein KKA07_06455 [Bacteroidetes bacterium]|nr:hypothetical protein [Bacteroidota bacterium]